LIPEIFGNTNVHFVWFCCGIPHFLVKELEKFKKEGVKIKQINKTTDKTKKEELFTFTCSICDQNKQHQKLHLVRINGIGYDPKKIQKICDFCINRIDIIKEEQDDFF